MSVLDRNGPSKGRISDSEKLAIFRVCLAAIAGREKGLPTRTPPNSKGETKECSPAFAAAVWASELTRCAIKVIEDDGNGNGKGSDSGSEPSGY